MFNKLDQLTYSLSKLRGSVETAITIFTQEDRIENQEIIERLKQYTLTVDKLASLIEALGMHIRDNKLPEIIRHVRIIKGMSSLVFQDVTELLSKTSCENPNALNPFEHVSH